MDIVATIGIVIVGAVIDCFGNSRAAN